MCDKDKIFFLQVLKSVTRTDVKQMLNSSSQKQTKVCITTINHCHNIAFAMIVHWPLMTTNQDKS